MVATEADLVEESYKDEWIEDIETLSEKMDDYIHAQKEANGFDLRYNITMSPSEKDWRDCSDVLVAARFYGVDD